MMRSTFAGDLGLMPKMRADGSVFYREPEVFVVILTNDGMPNMQPGGVTMVEMSEEYLWCRLP